MFYPLLLPPFQGMIGDLTAQVNKGDIINMSLKLLGRDNARNGEWIGFSPEAIGRLGKCEGVQVMIINWKHESSVVPIYAGF